MSTIAQRMKEALIIKGMKQIDLVEKTGIGKSSISTYLSGEYEPKQKNLYKIAKALEVDVSWLMGNDVPMEPSISKGGMTNYELAALINKLRNNEQLQQLLGDFNSLSAENKLIVINLVSALKNKEWQPTPYFYSFLLDNDVSATTERMKFKSSSLRFFK